MIRKSIVLFLLICSSLTGQRNTVVSHKAAPPPIGFVKSTQVTVLGSTPIPSITSPAITVNSGQFAVVYCRTVVSGITVTSTPANTFVTDPGGGTGTIGTLSISHSFLTTTASTTFTCTPGSNSGFMGMIVLIYNPGFLTTTDVNTIMFGNAGPSTTPTTGTFSTTAKGLIVECQVTFPATITAGLIAGNAGTLRQTDVGDDSTGNLACEDLITSGAVGGTAATTTNINNQWIAFVQTYK